MNRIYTTALAVAITAGGAMAQQARTAVGKAPSPRVKSMIRQSHPQPINNSMANRDIIWQNDFSNPSDWVIAHDGTENLDWQIGTGLAGTGGAPIDPIASTTAANGYAMLDSDGHNNQGTTYERSHMTMANPVSTVGYDAVVVEFETQYRKWTDEECYLVVSTDNINWPTVDATGITGVPGVYRVWPGMNTQDPVDNPTLKRINISDVAAQQATVWVRFYWVGIYGYLWFVDDVKIATPPPNDLLIDNSWVVGQPGIYDDTEIRNQEYTQLPLAETIPMDVRAAIYNNGGVTQTNVVLTATINGTPYSSSPISLGVSQSDSVVISTGYTPSAAGPVTVDFAVTSDSTASEANPDDNLDSRSFNVTADPDADGNSVMAVDTGAIDGRYLICATCTTGFDRVGTRFQIEGTGNMAYGIGVALYTQTSVGSSFNVYLRDANGDVVTIEFFEVLSSFPLNAAGEGQFVNIGFESPVELDPLSDYEVWIENLNTDTVAVGVSGNVTPGGLIGHTPGDATDAIYVGWSNPAPMIRLYLAPTDFVGINEHKENGLAIGISAPNPADVMTRIPFTLDNASEVNYQVMDINGKLVAQKNLGNLGSGQHTIDLDVQDLASGAYSFSLTAGAAHLSRTVVVAH